MIVKYGKVTETVDVSSILTVSELKTKFANLFHIPVERQRLIVNGKELLVGELQLNDLPHGRASTVTVMGSSEIITAPTKRELLQQKRVVNDLPGADKSAESDLIASKYRKSFHELTSGANAKELANRKYKFNRIETLPGFSPDSTAIARQILTSLSRDKGILHAMEKFQLEVGALCEMYPDGKVGESPVCVMGLNENKGQRILLRIRTDDLKGFRKHLSIRKVLYHELAHNRWGDHDDNFYRFMREIEAEVNKFNGGINESLTPEVPGSLPHTESGGKSGPHMFTLGGGGAKRDGTTASEGLDGDENARLRERIRVAALSRHRRDDITTVLTDQEMELDYTCGCSCSAEVPQTSDQVGEAELNAVETDIPVSDRGAEHVFLDVRSTDGSAGDIPESAAAVEPADSGAQEEELRSLRTRLESRISESVAAALFVDDGRGEGAVLGPVEKLTVLQDHLETLREHFLGSGTAATGAVQDRCSALRESLMLLANIIKKAKDSAEAKHRRINTTIAKYQRVIANVPGAEDILFLAGFVPLTSEALPGHGTGTIPREQSARHILLEESRRDTAWLYMLHALIESLVGVI